MARYRPSHHTELDSGAVSDPHAAFKGVKPVEERHQLDEAVLARWLEVNVEGFAGPLTINQFKGGQSNPTYQLVTPAKRYVLRKKPSGKLLPSAHAVDREYRVIAALHPTGFPVARPYALCTDDSVIGAMFYVMDMVEGRVLWDGTLPELSPAERRAVYEAKISTLARLHMTDYAAIGLGDYGKAGNYFARQIDRWSKQYKLSETETIPEMDRLIEWLPQTIPAGERTSIVHGDYRLDNLILHEREPHVVAVLDWELSTLGDPLGDFTYYLMNWMMPHDGRSGLAGLDLEPLGIPTLDRNRRALLRADRARRYRRARLVFCLQRLPPRRHPARHRRPHPRRHGRERARVRNDQTHPPTRERGVWVCAEGGIALSSVIPGERSETWNPGIMELRVGPGFQITLRVSGMTECR